MLSGFPFICLMSGILDRFSSVAEGYARYRPHYPDSLYQFLLSLQPHRDRAWDVGTGNGQVATVLSSAFREVIATDISAQQLIHAHQLPNVIYRICAAEESGIDTASVDLIAVGQAVHWFDIGKFAIEVQRVSRPHAVLTIWCYTLLETEPGIDALIRYLYEDVLNGFWDPQRNLIDRRYADIDFPFQEIQCPEFEMVNEYDAQDILGYLRTWSAVSKYRQQLNTDPVQKIEADIIAICGGRKVRCRTPLFMRAWTIS